MLPYTDILLRCYLTQIFYYDVTLHRYLSTMLPSAYILLQCYLTLISYYYGTESMHQTNQYNAAYFSGLVQNRCTYHTSTTPLTFLAWYRIDAPNTPIQRRSLFWLGKESMHLTHQYYSAYFSGLVKNRCTYHTNTTPLTFLAW
jgi:hypothetical protein